MIDVIRNSFNAQLESIAQYLQVNYHSESPESGFANYIFHQINTHIPLEMPHNLNADKLLPHRLNEAPVLATVGYNIACGKEFSEDFLKSWRDGLTRLSGRDAFPADRTSFFYRPTELLGITLGINYYRSQPNHSKWLQDILTQGEQKLIHSDHWTFLFSAYAASILSVTWKARSLPLIKDMTIDELALVKWLCSIEPNFTQTFGLTQSELLFDRTLLEQCINTSHCLQDSARAGILFFAIQTTLTKTLNLIWNECEQFQDNPHKSVEWLKTTCDNFHAVTQYLQAQLSRQSDMGYSNIRNMQMLLQSLPKLRSDADILEKIVEKLSLRSQPYIVYNKGTIITGDNVTMTQNQNESTTNNTTIHNNSSIGFIQSGNGTISDFSQNIGQNLDEITRLISSLRSMAQEFPEAEREAVLLHLDDLQEDINTPNKQKPQRIQHRLIALGGIAAMLFGIAHTAADFSNNILELSDKLGVRIPIELGQPQSTQELPPSVPK